MKKSLKIDVINRQSRLMIRTEEIKKLARQIIKFEAKNKQNIAINICFVDDCCIKNLNWRFLGKNNATDVLAFENSDLKNKLQADVIISTQAAVKNSKNFKTTPEYETRLYVAHGILHLLGYDDNNKQREILMRQAESKYVH